MQIILLSVLSREVPSFPPTRITTTPSTMFQRDKWHKYIKYAFLTLNNTIDESLKVDI